MTTRAERALAALAATLAPCADALVRENLGTLDLTAYDTALAVEAGDPETLAETLSPWTRHVSRDVAVTLIARARAEADARAAFEALAAAVGAALAADRTLGGAAQGVIWGGLRQVGDDRIEGGPDVIAAVLPVTIFYAESGANPLEALP